MEKTIVLSLGGSLIFPDKINVDFLKRFRQIIEKYLSRGFRFFIYCGGGRLARDFQQAASSIIELSNEELDWLGIYATRLNAELVKSIFKRHARSVFFGNPSKKIDSKKKLVIAAGYSPGWSTDYDAVMVARSIGSKEIINMSSADYVYDKDPKKFPGSKKIERIGWEDYLKLIDCKWKAGMNAPFDPVASREAQKLKITVCIIGNDLVNFENLLEGKKFKGTIIGKNQPQSG